MSLLVWLEVGGVVLVKSSINLLPLVPMIVVFPHMMMFSGGVLLCVFVWLMMIALAMWR